MCLDILVDSIEVPEPKIGYKIFIVKNNKLFGFVYGNNEVYKPGEWYEDKKEYTIVAGMEGKNGEDITYPTGYHIIINKDHLDDFINFLTMNGKGAYDLEYWKVEFDDIVVKGIEQMNSINRPEGIPTIVARKMRLVELVEKYYREDRQYYV